MRWKESYLLGVDVAIELFCMTEELINAVKDTATVGGLSKDARLLRDYVICHFRDEEKYQRSIHYSGLEAHKA